MILYVIELYAQINASSTVKSCNTPVFAFFHRHQGNVFRPFSLGGLWMRLSFKNMYGEKSYDGSALFDYSNLNDKISVKSMSEFCDQFYSWKKSQLKLELHFGNLSPEIFSYKKK